MSRLGETIPGVLGTTIVVLCVLILLAVFGFSLYLLGAVIGPWIVSSLMAAAISQGLALFIVTLPALIFAAPLFAFLCLFLGHEVIGHHLPRSVAPPRYFDRRPFELDGHTDLLDILFKINFTLSLLAGIGAGTYLSVLIVPTFISALTATGTSYLLALSAGVVTGGAFITLTILFLMALLWIYWRIMALPGVKDLKENPLQILSLLGMLAGLAFGGYLVSLVAPLLIAALAPISIPHSVIIFAIIIICSELVLTTSFFTFATASGIPYLFNRLNFKPFVNYCGRCITTLTKLIETPKPLPEIDPDRIKQALAEYHRNKPFWRKLLSLFSHSLGTNRDIEKIERFIKDNPNWQGNQEALKSLLRERATHTHGTYRFYTHSPNSPVNKAYISIAKAMASQPNTATPNYAAWGNLLEVKDSDHDARDSIATDLVVTGTKSEKHHKLFLISSIRKIIGKGIEPSPEAKRLVSIVSDATPQETKNTYEIRYTLPPQLYEIILKQCEYELVPLSELKDKDNSEPKESKLYIGLGTSRYDDPIHYVMMDAKEEKKGTINEYVCRQIVKSAELPKNLGGWKPHTRALVNHILGIAPAEIQETEAIPVTSFKKNVLACFFSLLVATFYDEESDIAFKEVSEYALTHGLLKGNILHDLSLFKLLNPLRWVEFCLRLSLNITVALISIGVLIDNLLDPLLHRISYHGLGIGNDSLNAILTILSISIIGFFRYCISLPIKMICKALIAILTSITSTVIFLLRSLSAPIDTVLTPCLKLYREQPIKFFALLLISTTVVAFLMTGFELGAALPGIMWLSNSLFGLASLASAGSPVLMAMMSTLLIGLFLYETMAILDALIIPFIIMALTTLKNGLYYLSEMRFAHAPRYPQYRYDDEDDPVEEQEREPALSADDILPKFDSRYPVSLEMPSLSSQPYVCLDPENLGRDPLTADVI